MKASNPKSAPVFLGRELFFKALHRQGVEVVFGNPGTTELPLIEELTRHTGIKYQMALHEAVAVNAADGYAQATGKVGVVNLHVAPGLGNGLGMVYNAWEGRTPLLVTAGQADTRMRLREPFLGHDLVAMAAPVTKWSVQAQSPEEIPLIVERAFQIALTPPMGPVFVALPINVMEASAPWPAMPEAAAMHRHTRLAPAEQGLHTAAQWLLEAQHPVILCGDGVGFGGAVPQLVSLAETLQAQVWDEWFATHLNFPWHHPLHVGDLPDRIGGIAQKLAHANTDLVLAVGGEFFEESWFDEGSPFPPGCRVIQLDPAPSQLGRHWPVHLALQGDIALGLADLQHHLVQLVQAQQRNAPQKAQHWAKTLEQRQQAAEKQFHQRRQAQQEREQALWANQPISTARLMAELAQALPTNAVLVEESITADMDLHRSIPMQQPGSYFAARGGGIGQAFPTALGVRLAKPGRPLVTVSGDGSAQYTIQSLWTAAHERLPILFIVLHNRAYQVLKINQQNYQRAYAVKDPQAVPMLDLTGPDPDFVHLAAGYGVAAKSVKLPEEVAPALKEALEQVQRTQQPFLLDVWTAPGL